NSSNENNKKIRLVYAFDSNINVDVAKNIAQKLITILEYVFLTAVDKASKNIKQIFYGTKNNVFVNTNLRIYNSTKADSVVIRYVANTLKLECICYISNFNGINI
ncbi:hypothetical protein KQ876_03550, partial [Mycoplasma sp. CSL7491-lung]|uniref:hypothetical protein n=1 Tax=Mycoplasma sp. CSL7491-lung TaxID=549718 RepID=UPI001C111BAC